MVDLGVRMYFLHKAFPEIVGPEYTLRAAGAPDQSLFFTSKGTVNWERSPLMVVAVMVIL